MYQFLNNYVHKWLVVIFFDVTTKLMKCMVFAFELSLMVAFKSTDVKFSTESKNL